MCRWWRSSQARIDIALAERKAGVSAQFRRDFLPLHHISYFIQRRPITLSKIKCRSYKQRYWICCKIWLLKVSSSLKIWWVKLIIIHTTIAKRLSYMHILIGTGQYHDTSIGHLPKNQILRLSTRQKFPAWESVIGPASQKYLRVLQNRFVFPRSKQPPTDC